MDYRYVFGPVPSRRLGQSLGISPIPPKTCNYSCIYCQLGRTKFFINDRQMFFPVEDVVAEVKDALSQYDDIDFITFVGEGEPTLYLGIGETISMIKSYTPTPIAVITNGALLYDSDVRHDLMYADVLMPTLDAPSEELWRRINRPHVQLHFHDVLKGLFQMRSDIKGEMWLEVMLVKGMNDSKDVLLEMRRIIDDLRPHRVYINVPIRPPAESFVEKPDDDSVKMAAEILGATMLGAVEKGIFYVEGDNPVQGILHIIKRHPMREAQIVKVAQCKGWNVDNLVDALRRRDDVEVVSAHGVVFYRYKVW